MQKCHQKAIRGMSIACIVLAGLAVFASLIVAIALAAIGPSAIAASGTLTPSAFDASIYDTYGHHGHYYYDFDDVYGLYGDDYGTISSATAALIVNVCIVICAFCLLLSAACLVAGIIALRSCNDPSKYGSIMGWSIVGAVCSGLSGSIASLVLFIIIAVFVSKDKKMYAMGYVPDAAGNFCVPSGAVYGQPQAPITQSQPMPAAPVPTPSVPPTEAPVAQPQQLVVPQSDAAQPPVPAEPQPAVVETVVVEPAQLEAPATDGNSDGYAPAGSEGNTSDSDGSTHPQP